MRVLHLSADPGVPILGHKGASVHVRALTRALTRRGAEVIVASPRVDPEGDVLDAPAKLVAIAPVLPKQFADPAGLRAAMDAQAVDVIKVAIEFAVDAVYERFSLFSDAGVIAAANLGVPHVLEVNAPLREEARRFRTLPHADFAADVERAVLSATSRVLVVSQPLVATVVASGADRRIVEVVPNGVACDAPFAKPGRDPGAFTVGFAGSLKPWHGIETLLDAVKLATDEAPNLRLEVIGHGPLAHLLSDSGLPDTRLIHLGALPHGDTLARIATWNVGVAPYLPLEDFYFSPLKVLEYMAAGICPVASELGELPALLGDGARGVLVAPGDAAGLARVLVRLAREPELASRLGAAARAYVRAHRDWDVNAARVLDALTTASGARS